MSAPGVPIVWYLAYTGSNSAAIVTHVNQFNPSVSHTWEIQSESNGVLVISYYTDAEDQAQVTLHTGDYLVINPINLYETRAVTATEYAQLYRSLATTLSAGSATVPSLVGNAQTTVSVNLNVAFPSNAYTPVAFLSGGVSLLSSLSVLSVTIVNGYTVNVVVKNTGLLTLAGAIVTVIATG